MLNAFENVVACPRSIINPHIITKPKTSTRHIYKTTKVFDENSIIISPNPTSGIVEIKSKIPIEKVNVFDFSGRLVLESFNQKIDLSNYNSGVYFLKIETSKGVSIKKIIIL